MQTILQNYKSVFVDSFNLLVPVKYISFNEPRYIHKVDSITGEIISSVFDYDITDNYGVMYRVRKKSIFGKDYYSFLINSKMRYIYYNQGITNLYQIETILLAYKAFFNFDNHCSIEHIFNNSILLDLDFTLDLDSSYLYIVENFLSEYRKRKPNTYRFFRKSKILSGMQYSNRLNSDSSVFLKFYRKDIEFNESEFAKLLCLSFPHGCWRIEITMRNKKQFGQYNFNSNNDIFDEKKILLAFENVLNYHGIINKYDYDIKLKELYYTNPLKLSFDKKAIISLIIKNMILHNCSFDETFKEFNLNGYDSSISRYRSNLFDLTKKVLVKSKINFSELNKDLYISKKSKIN